MLGFDKKFWGTLKVEIKSNQKNMGIEDKKKSYQFFYFTKKRHVMACLYD